MKEFIAQIANTKNYVIRVWAADETAAKERALKEWIRAATIGQWEISDETTEIVALTLPPGETKP